jgi:hypothetical protein
MSKSEITIIDKKVSSIHTQNSSILFRNNSFLFRLNCENLEECRHHQSAMILK